ncbi:MAG: hypothetical protein LBV63_02020 [Candidatus Methanoplasma sp.]|jgi:hypothetical protein|nr:hypothetical protein [Candidatus Methanoplasma sp.]
MTKIPGLKKLGRDYIFNKYSEDQHSKIVYNYLFKGKTHEELDEYVLGIHLSNNHNGWQSGEVLRHLGITGEFRGIFDDTKVAINDLRNAGKEYETIVYYIERYIHKKL